MDTQIYKFKTNINCSGCVAKVTPFLNGVEDIQNWSVDTAQPAKPLQVTATAGAQAKIIQAVQSAGFKADPA